MRLFSEYRGLRKEIYVLFFGRIVTNLGSMIWPMLTLILRNKLGMNASDIATYTLVISLFSFPMCLIGGKMADKFNKRNIIIISDCISIVCYFICGILPFSRPLIVVMAIASMMQTLEWPSYDSLITDLTTPKERNKAFSLSYLGANLGLVLSPTLGGILVNKYLSLAFIINAISISLSTILIFFLIKDVRRVSSEDDKNIYETEIEGNQSIFSFLKTSRVLVLYLIASALEVAMYNQYNFLMPLDMNAAYGENGSILYGAMSSTNCIVVVLCTAFVTKLSKKLADINKIRLGTLLIVSGLSLFMIGVKVLPLCFVSIIIFTIGEILCTISSSPFTSKRTPASHRGRMNSMLTIVGGASNAIFIKIIGYIYDSSGSTASWSAVILVGITSVIIISIATLFDKKDYSELYNK